MAPLSAYALAAAAASEAASLAAMEAVKAGADAATIADAFATAATLAKAAARAVGVDLPSPPHVQQQQAGSTRERSPPADPVAKRARKPPALVCSYTTRVGEPCKVAAEHNMDGLGKRACRSHWCSTSAPRNKCVYPACDGVAYMRERYGGASLCDVCYLVKNRVQFSGPASFVRGVEAGRTAWWAAWKAPLANPDSRRGVEQAQWGHTFGGGAANFFASGGGSSTSSGGKEAQGATDAAPPRKAPPTSADYTLLGVTPTSRASDVRQAYLGLARLCHPDRLPSADATARFQQLQVAYERVFENAHT